jgi:hypothetical protein
VGGDALGKPNRLPRSRWFTKRAGWARSELKCQGRLRIDPLAPVEI